MGWTYYEYMAQPIWFRDILWVSWEAELESNEVDRKIQESKTEPSH